MGRAGRERPRQRCFRGQRGKPGLGRGRRVFRRPVDRGRLQPGAAIGRRWAKVFFRLPAAAVSAAYDYSWDPGRNRVTFRYESTVSRPGRIRLLLPRALSAAELDVRRDGRPVPFTVERLEEDSLLTMETDFAPHILVIRAKNSPQGQSRP